MDDDAIRKLMGAGAKGPCNRCGKQAPYIGGWYDGNTTDEAIFISLLLQHGAKAEGGRGEIRRQERARKAARHSATGQGVRGRAS
jgi:hypothetical protein